MRSCFLLAGLACFLISISQVDAISAIGRDDDDRTVQTYYDYPNLIEQKEYFEKKYGDWFNNYIDQQPESARVLIESFLKTTGLMSEEIYEFLERRREVLEERPVCVQCWDEIRLRASQLTGEIADRVETSALQTFPGLEESEDTSFEILWNSSKHSDVKTIGIRIHTEGPRRYTFEIDPEEGYLYPTHNIIRERSPWDEYEHARQILIRFLEEREAHERFEQNLERLIKKNSSELGSPVRLRTEDSDSDKDRYRHRHSRREV